MSAVVATSSSVVRSAVAVAAGLTFGLGLGVAGMTNPEKVVGFLDVGGNWDPSLLVVMGTAVPVNALAWWLAKRRGQPVADQPQRKVDGKLVAGAALFGVGWGLGGICPGPGLVSLAAAGQTALVFVPAMIAGMGLYRWFGRS